MPYCIIHGSRLDSSDRVYLLRCAPRRHPVKERDGRTMRALGAVSAVVGNGEGRVQKSTTKLHDGMCYTINARNNR